MCGFLLSVAMGEELPKLKTRKVFWLDSDFSWHIDYMKNFERKGGRKKSWFICGSVIETVVASGYSSIPKMVSELDSKGVIDILISISDEVHYLDRESRGSFYSELSKAISKSKALRTLILSSNNAGWMDLSFLKSIPNIEYLGLEGISSRDLSPISSLTKLKWLEMSAPYGAGRGADFNFNKVSFRESLQGLSLTFREPGKIHDVIDFSSFLGLKDIKLKLEEGELSDFALQDISKPELLSSLELAVELNVSISSAQFPALNTLSLSCKSDNREAGAIISGCSNTLIDLEIVGFKGSKEVTDSLNSCEKLESLVLAYCEFQKGDEISIASLKALDIRHTTGLSVHADCLDKLSKLTFDDTSLTPDRFSSFLENSAKKEVAIYSKTPITSLNYIDQISSMSSIQLFFTASESRGEMLGGKFKDDYSDKYLTGKWHDLYSAKLLDRISEISDLKKLTISLPTVICERAFDEELQKLDSRASKNILESVDHLEMHNYPFDWSVAADCDSGKVLVCKRMSAKSMESIRGLVNSKRMDSPSETELIRLTNEMIFGLARGFSDIILNYWCFDYEEGLPDASITVFRNPENEEVLVDLSKVDKGIIARYLPIWSSERKRFDGYAFVAFPKVFREGSSVSYSTNAMITAFSKKLTSEIHAKLLKLCEEADAAKVRAFLLEMGWEHSLQRR